MQIYGGNSRALADVDPSKNSVVTSLRPAEQRGSYRLQARTGSLTVVAAKTATAGHLFAFRNAANSPTILMAIRRLKLRWQTITAFTSAQQIGLEAYVMRGSSASYTGGTAIPGTVGGFKKRASMPASLLTDARISTTGALTAGTQTLDTQQFFGLVGTSQTGADPAVSGLEAEYAARGDEHPLILSQNEGIVVANSILMGAAGLAVVSVDIEWDEMTSY